MSTTAIAWLRSDLRIADNPALSAAASHGDKVVALYIHEEDPGVRPPGSAGQWWLHQSLVSLAADLASIGIVLEVRRGLAGAVIDAIVEQRKADAVFWNRRYAPGERTVDEAVKDQLKSRGVKAESFAANVLHEPWTIQTGQGKPYSVYSPFWKTLRGMSIEAPLRRPAAREAIEPPVVDADYRQPRWADKLGQHWSIGEAAAHKSLSDFLDDKVADYPAGRDVPAQNATSRMSPHLRHGEISPRQIWHAAMSASHAHHGRAAMIDKYLSELGWRDFNYHQLYHREDIATKPMQPKYAGMQWRDAPDDLAAWEAGQTGIPMVDAGMRELWETGYMENRVRMLTASLLTKNMLIDWRDGEAWFWDCLVDGDMANNPGNWQWVAGSGLDAAPYFRIFNPVTQGEKFDSSGLYVRQWMPELAQLPDKYVHRPSEAPAEVLQAAGVSIGGNYPAPIVDLKATRTRALEAADRL